ncbi:ABC transporter substrate-binding protein [Litorihabitans aurantiacus]|uniref:Sugar ABC transporter substrate-binding protein n=1 Tax=Litorihabitans aurantiacus TaxID=1930061 RepID=A0AA37UU97_9MICO|nr:sugar ABC transporter substrate-binding protein [Litorihabitans aurantiacus]GMA30321.1 hypothetical protein GCM10025875_03130 [Litorihabitans aurantiacus]
MPQTTLSRRTLLGAGAGLTMLSALSAAGCAPRQDPNTLTMSIFGDQSSADELRARLLEPIRELDPAVKLRVVATPGKDWNEFFAKLLTQIASGSRPDIVSVATEGVQLMAGRGLATPLDDLVTRDLPEIQDYFDDVSPSLVEAMMHQGSLFLLPNDYNAGHMFYSPPLFEEAGVALPSPSWTVDDFYEAGRAIARLPDVNAYDWVVRLWGSWTSFLYANDGNLLEQRRASGGEWLWSSAYAGDPDAAGRGGGWDWGAPTANDTPAVEALELMIELKKEGIAPSPDVGGGQTSQALFAAGRVGMSVGGGFWAGGLHNAGMAPGTFDVTYFPRWRSQRHLFGTAGYAILESSQKRELAWEVLKRMTRPDAFDIQFPGNVTTPARRSLSTAERYATTGPEGWRVFSQTLVDFPETAPIPAPSYFNALSTALNQRTTEAISTGDARAALDGLQIDLETAAGAAP